MKNSNIQISLLIVILFFPFLWKYQEINAQNVAITDDDTYNADSSAMLDIKSISKGMLVPRLTTAQRNAVSNPATGLLVFDTDAGSFYFFNGTLWTNLSSGNANGVIGYTSPDKVYLNDITDKFGIGTVSPSGKLDVKSDVSIGLEKPIFNVVNSTGDTVFAVYEQGVRINVYDDPTGKATANKGGFAVGGFSPAKAGFTNEYLRITPDSVRIYIEENSGAKATANKGGFAVGGFSPAKAGLTNEYLRITNDSTRIYTQDTIKGFGVKNIGASSTTSYMQLTPSNYFIGHESGKAITSGLYNSFMGHQAGKNSTSCLYNVFLGYQSGLLNITGENNVFIGNKSGYNNDGGTNVFIGNYSGYDNTYGSSNNFIGNYSGMNNINGNSNCALGYQALGLNTSGSSNVAIGGLALFSSNQSYNTVVGSSAGYYTTNQKNTFIGSSSFFYNTSGGYNVGVGYYAGVTVNPANANTTGSYNTFIGYLSGLASTTQRNNATAIGSGARVDCDNCLVLGSYTGTTYVGIGTATPSYPLEVNGNARINGSLKGNAGASGLGASLADRGNDNNISFDWDGGTLRFYVDVTNVKNFIIDNPVDNNKYLVHTTLEGPENGVYYRGTSKLENGKAVVELPEYFDALTQNNTATVILTPKGKTPFLLSYDEFNETTFAVYGNITDGEFDWEVKAERQDVPNIIVEPFKNEITVHGDGPYKYYSVKRNANIFTKYNQFAKN